ncbi:SPFH domain-containing protein [Pseudomonas sp. 3296]|uniref:SPFH domain-containing protein n=1 Tax=Pseudomonas sp. 3296 TaxID=2817753 RepID=UPI003862140E
MRNVSVVAVLVLACGYVSSDIFYSVSAQEFGIILRNGRLVGTAMPGPGWKLPFVDSVVSISMQENITNGILSRLEKRILM